MTHQMKWLEETHHLFHHQTITHRYPFASQHALTTRYDWRAKTPVLFRVTPQWFINIQRIVQDCQIEQQLLVRPHPLSDP